jgi:flagellar basal-body rod modification protein FlgD
MAITSVAPNTTSPGTQMKGKKQFDLKPQDFIKMMITQLQNQDPTSPAKNEELLAQMSQIGQLQASTTLTESIKGMVLQNQIGSAGNLIGKSVQGLTDTNEQVGGIVNSVRVQDDNVMLELDNGHTLALGRVTAIAPAPNTAKGMANGLTAGFPTTSQSSTGPTAGGGVAA